MEKKYKIGIISGGAFGTAMAVSVADTAKKSDLFHETVSILVNTEMYNNTSFVDLINKERMNKKYLPNILLPENITATTDKNEVEEWDILVFAVPHEHFISVCEKISVKKGALLISLTKGFVDTNFTTPSAYLQKVYKERVFVLMGANIALDIAQKKMSHSTLGYEKKDEEVVEKVIFPLFNSDHLILKKICDLKGIELCGALKNVIAVVYGITEGLELGPNVLSAIFNEGIKETRLILQEHDRNPDLIFESCGIQDIFVTCLAGRNRKCGVILAKENVLGDFTSQGIGTCIDLYKYLAKSGSEGNYPLVCALYKILTKKETDFEKAIFGIFKK